MREDLNLISYIKTSLFHLFYIKIYTFKPVLHNAFFFQIYNLKRKIKKFDSELCNLMSDLLFNIFDERKINDSSKNVNDFVVYFFSILRLM
jgi:hypothetical protein